MAVVAGLNKTGVFILLSEKILSKVADLRTLIYILVLLCFFTSMWITNDVALITFVPFTIMLLSFTHQSKHMIFVIVMQTIAANLGSMLTPVGNPQNLYLYSYYHIPIQEFISIVLPITSISFVLISITMLFIKKESLTFTLPEVSKSGSDSRGIVVYSILFLICLCCVLRVIDYPITLLIVLFSIIIFDRSLLLKVDYLLLLTFVSFFIFIGNIGNITVVKGFISHVLNGRELIVSVLLSQGISNVPAAVLLSAFTKDYKSFLIGTNLGGLGTLIASLASLISYKFYCKTEGAQPFKYLVKFSLYNVSFLVLLLLFVL
jgi:Na+/H+ antiporter NhaD/arsenite permease-like protein